MCRRFKYECAKDDSVLFGKVPPKRLNEKLFERACQSPLDRIFTQHAPQLQNVPGTKVAAICRWKVRKIRGNVKNKNPAQFILADDGFDFLRAQQALERDSVTQRAAQEARPLPRRRSAFQVYRSPAPAPSDTTPRQDVGADTTPRQDVGADTTPRQDVGANTTPRQDVDAAGTFAVGDRVSAMWCGDKKYYAAKILSVRSFKNGVVRYKVRGG